MDKRNYAELVDNQGQTVAVYDYDSGLYDNGLPSYNLLDGWQMKFYKNGQLASVHIRYPKRALELVSMAGGRQQQ